MPLFFQSASAAEKEIRLRAQLEECEKIRQDLVEKLSSSDLQLRQKGMEVEKTQSKCAELLTQVTLLSADVDRLKVVKIGHHLCV